MLLFRTVRGKWVSLRALATGAQREALRIQDQSTTNNHYFHISKDGLMILTGHLLSALAVGGVVEQMLDSDAKHYLAMVSPRHQRLIAALSPLRIGADKHIADATDRLAIAGREFADKASSWTSFRHAEKDYRRRLRDFRNAAKAN